MLGEACYNWKQPIAYYFCEGTTSAAKLKIILKELVAKVAESGQIPIVLVCDQEECVENVQRGGDRIEKNECDHNGGIIEVAGQNLSVVFDPPHLLKGLRNNGAVAT